MPIDRNKAAERRARIRDVLEQSRALLERSARARRGAEAALQQANAIARFLANEDRKRALEWAADALKIAKAENTVVPFPPPRRKRA